MQYLNFFSTTSLKRVLSESEVQLAFAVTFIVFSLNSVIVTGVSGLITSRGTSGCSDSISKKIKAPTKTSDKKADLLFIKATTPVLFSFLIGVILCVFELIKSSLFLLTN